MTSHNVGVSRLRDISIRFVLRKGEGDWPQLSRLSTLERNDLKQISTFVLVWDDNFGDPLTAGIVSVAMIYDGITALRLGSQTHGLYVASGSITGFPSPILRFTCSDEVDADDLKKAVWTSYVRLQAAKDTIDGNSGFYCEDHQGYTEVVDARTIGQLEDALKRTSIRTYRQLNLDMLRAGCSLASVSDDSVSSSFLIGGS